MSRDRPLFLFVHLQKTAGTALLRRLRHHFGDERVYPLRDEQGRPETVLDVERMVRRATEMGDALDVVTGHFPLCVADLLPGPVVPFTVLREPVERTLSFLRHQREVEPRFADATLEEVYADPVSTGELLTDHMVKMLSLTVDEMTDGALTPVDVDDRRVERALTALDERFEVFGLQEHFELLCDELARAHGWDLGPPVFMNRTTPGEAPEALREQIRRDNVHDVRFYERAVRLWHRRHGGGDG